jgi:cholesterol transport system auxiliary component
MKYLLIGLLLLSTLLSGTGCSHSPKQPVLHDFGSPVPISTSVSKDGNKLSIIVDAPTWLWDDRIRYRLLYASPTRVGFYAMDLWVAPPPELFEQLLISSGKTRNYNLTIRLQDFEQQFDAPDRARVMLRFSVEAYSGDDNKKVNTQEFYLEQATTTPDASGAVSGFANLTRKAADRIQVWLAGLADKPL